MLILVVLFAVLMSIPWLVPHLGFLALFGIVPLLCLEHIAFQTGQRHFWWWHYGAFVLWNAITTFWVCNATVGGGIFAVLANSLQMSVIFALFHFSRKKLRGALPYIFLAAMWIAWERWYFVSAQISWPWLVLGNAFARTTHLVQWYEFTGTLGGSLWVWATNLGIFGLMASLSSGSWGGLNIKARSAALTSIVVALFAPMTVSGVIYYRYQEVSEDKVDVVIGQPNFDPYQKFSSLSQQQQNAILLDLYKKELKDDSSVLLLAPETFTSGVVLDRYDESPTWRTFYSFLQEHKSANILFGASTYGYFMTSGAPSIYARKIRDDFWVESHNSAMMMDASARTEIFHKSKLVVGTELTPYPRFFNKIDDMLGGVMARCSGQDEISVLHFQDRDSTGAVVRNIPVGSIVCYESIYPEYCTGYVKKGAKFLTVITNDAWWGNTAGYKQHFSYSRLRAIETRRDIARCGNTGISAFIDQRGDVVTRGPWWEACVMRGSLNLNSKETFFVKNGDVVGRVCTFVFLLLLLYLVSVLIPRDAKKVKSL